MSIPYFYSKKQKQNFPVSQINKQRGGLLQQIIIEIFIQMKQHPHVKVDWSDFNTLIFDYQSYNLFNGFSHLSKWLYVDLCDAHLIFLYKFLDRKDALEESLLVCGFCAQ